MWLFRRDNSADANNVIAAAAAAAVGDDGAEFAFDCRCSSWRSFAVSNKTLQIGPKHKSIMTSCRIVCDCKQCHNVTAGILVLCRCCS